MEEDRIVVAALVLEQMPLSVSFPSVSCPCATFL
jgi:hypothetical protein